MRLICPNCDAQYEVADEAIPAEGRDVQCSNCGHAWFQEHPSVLAAREEAEALPDLPPASDDSAELPEAPVLTPEPPEEAPAPEETPTPEPRPAARRSGLDESLMAVLREEAEREAQARAHEQPRGLEVQGELGLDTVGAPATAARAARVKMIPPEEADEAEVIGARAGKGRDLLPDIEVINSTLRPSSERDEAAPDRGSEQARRSTFRSGFSLMLLIAVAVALVYVMAPRIAAQVPALAKPMAGYVEGVDAARLWVDALMQRAIAALQG